MTPRLAVEGLRAGYGRTEVLHGVDLAVAPGEILAIIGPNGAGKTTLMAALMGLLPRTGTVAIDGAPASARTEALVADGVLLVPETRALFAGLSIDDNLALGAYRRRGGPDQRDRVFALFPRLAERRRQHAGTLSGGERQMLALGRALMARPRLLLLDEPSLGLAPRVTADIFAVLGRLRDDGLAILLVEQNARGALALADRACLLELGEVVLAGPAAALAADPRVAASYLGGGG